jgi:RNA polymerase sigma-70 factor (ECF subfamily)
VVGGADVVTTDRGSSANRSAGIKRPTTEMIEGKAGEGRRVMVEHSARAADEHLWATFEAEALPHADRLFRLAMWFERDRSAAEDLVQETMLQALQSFHRFEAGTNCRAWLATILQHVRSNRRRARDRSPLVEDPDDRVAQMTPFQAPVPQQLSDEDVLAALKRIPVQFQEVIVLCDVEELTYKEIAEALAIPIGTVMSRLHRGRASLRSELETSAAAFSRPRVVK